MYIICYYSKELKNNTWERVGGEDAMQIRASELCESGLNGEDVFVFCEADEFDVKSSNAEQLRQNDDFKRICHILDTSMSLAGYKIMDGGTDWVVVRNSHKDKDFEIRIRELD